MLPPRLTPAAAALFNSRSHLNALIFIIFPFTYLPLTVALRRRLRLAATRYPRTHRLSERVVRILSFYSVVAFMQLLVHHPDAIDALCRLVINCGVCIDTFETFSGVSQSFLSVASRSTEKNDFDRARCLRRKEVVGSLGKHFLCHQYWYGGESLSAEELLLTIQLSSRK